MFYSGYLSLYLLQFLNIKPCQTILTQRAHTTIDGLIDDALFPENGPVFMQRLHEVHPVRRSSEEKIKRRFGDTYAPETEKTIEAFNDRLINDPAFDYPVSTETPIEILYQSTGFMPMFDNANPYNRDDTMRRHNVSLINVYDDYTAIKTTVQNVNGNRKYQTGVAKKIDDINVINPSATKIPILFEPNGQTFTPKMYEDYPTGSKSTQDFDFLMDGPDFNPRLYDEDYLKSTEKSIQRYNEPLHEPSFTFQKFDVTRFQTTKIKKITRKFNRTVLKKIADVFYPEMETTAKRSHRTRKGRFKQRSRITNPIASKTTIPRLVVPQKLRPAFIQQSGDAIKETTIKKLNIPLLNYLAFMQEQRNPRARDVTIQRFNEPLLRNSPELMQNYDVTPPKTETAMQRSPRTRKHKPRLKYTRKTKVQRFDGPLKYTPGFEAKFNEDYYPPASVTTDFMQNHVLNSFITKNATIQRFKRPFSSELSFIQRRQQNPTIRDKTIQRLNEPLRNGPDLIQNFDANLPTTETVIHKSLRTRKHKLEHSRKTKIQRFDRPQKHAPEFEAKTNEDKYPPALETTDFRQNHDLNSPKIETASQLLRGTPKHNPTFIKEIHETYPQKSETTTQRIKKPVGNGSDFDQKVNEDYPPALETTDFRQNHDLNSPKIETASQLFRGTREHKPTFKKVMEGTYPQKSETIIQRLKKPLRNGPDFGQKVSKNNYPPALETTDFRQSHDLNSPIIETASLPLRGTPKHKPTYKKVMDVTHPQKSEITIQRLKKPLRNGPDFEQNINEDHYPPALQTGPTFKLRFDVTVPHSRNYRVQRLDITPSFAHASISVVNPLSNLNPSFQSKHKPEMQKTYTINNLVSPAYIRSPATHPIAETGISYPWVKTAYPPGSNLESTVSYSPNAELANPWITREVFPETSKSYYVPSTTLVYEIKPQVLRAPVPEPTQLKQETYTNIDEPTQDPMFAENVAPKRESQDESPEPEEDDHTLAETPESEEDDHTLTETPESEEDDTIELQKQYRGLTDKTGLKQEATDVVGEGTDPFSMFLRKLVGVLVSKNIKELRNLIQPFGRYVTTLVDSGKLMKLGVSTGSFIAQSTSLLHAPVKQIRRYLFIAQVSLENRRRMLDDGTNTLLDEMDDVYDAGEEEAMQRILTEITMYPNTSRSEEEIVKDLVDDIFLHPMHRMAGTTQGNVIFEYIGKFCNKYQYARRNEKLEEHTIIGPNTFSEDKGISTQNYIKTRGITRTEVEKISSKHDISTRGITRLEIENNITDSSNDSKYSGEERSEVEIRIRINSGKHYHENKICNSRGNCVKINKANFRKFDERESYRSTTKKTNNTLVGNTDSEKLKKDEHESSKTENRRKNTATVKVKLDCILSDKKVGKGNGTGVPLTEMIMFCSNDNDPDGSDPGRNSSDTSDNSSSDG